MRYWGEGVNSFQQDIFICRKLLASFSDKGVQIQASSDLSQKQPVNQSMDGPVMRRINHFRAVKPRLEHHAPGIGKGDKAFPAMIPPHVGGVERVRHHSHRGTIGQWACDIDSGASFVFAGSRAQVSTLNSQKNWQLIQGSPLDNVILRSYL